MVTYTYPRESIISSPHLHFMQPEGLSWCEIWGYHDDVVEDSGLLGCHWGSG